MLKRPAADQFARAGQPAIKPEVFVRKQITMDNAARLFIRLDSDKARHRLAKRHLMLTQCAAS
jgi:hypothetical protein